jgi:hypothetical protein
MKQRIFVLLLSLAFVVSASADNKYDTDRALHSAQISLEQVEAYKLDDGEYKGAVTTKSSFGSESSQVGVGLVGLLIALTGLFRRNKEGIGLAALFIVGSFIFNVEVSAAMAVLPLVPFMRSPDVETISGEEVKKLLSEMSTAHKKEIGDLTTKIGEAVKGLMTPDVLKAELEKLGMKAEEIKTLSDAVVEQGKVLADLKAKGERSNEGKDIQQVVDEQGTALKALADKGEKNDQVKFKINKTIISRGGVTSNTMGIRLPGVGQLPTRGAVIKSLFTNVTLSAQDIKDSNGVIRYLDQNAITRSAAAVSEITDRTVGASNKPESAISWIERTRTLETLADSIPVTKQSYRNLGFVAGEIDFLLRKNLALVEDSQLYSGDGNTPNLKGVYTTATAATLTELPGYQTIGDANLYDLMASMKVYIMNGGLSGTGKQSKYLPNFVVMNPTDILKYKLLKAVNGHYLLPPFLSADGTRIDNMLVVESSIVTANTMLVGDFDYGKVYTEEDVTVTMGLVNDQFIKNQWTILAEQVECLLIRDVDADAFLKVTNINAAIAALNKV